MTDATEAPLAIAKAALHRLALDEPMTEMDEDQPARRAISAELNARIAYAAGTLETIGRLGEPEAASVLPDVAADWTIEPSSGRSNSSEQFLAIAREVERLIHAEFRVLDKGLTAAAARLIVAQLAHAHGLAPAGAISPAQSEATAESDAKPPVRLANVEVKGFRDLGVVAVSEITLAGVPFLHAESRDGSAADFPASSVHFIAWLPPGAPWPEKPKAITSRPASFGWPGEDADDEDEDAWIPDLHAIGCSDPECQGDCDGERPF